MARVLSDCLNDILAPIVVCIFDRSVADETAAGAGSATQEHSLWTGVWIRDQLGFFAPEGVEALAFTVALLMAPVSGT